MSATPTIADANVVYDALAQRQGFKRQPGMRDRLSALASLLALTGWNPTCLHIVRSSFSPRQQYAFGAALNAVGPQVIANLIARQAADQSLRYANINQEVFDFFEET